MENIANAFKSVKKSYDSGRRPLSEIERLTIFCIDKINSIGEMDYGFLRAKHYHVKFADINSRKNKSRPFRKDLFFLDVDEFKESWKRIISSKGKCCFLSSDDSINKCIYTVVMSFSMCYDIWKNGSRKTPGTYFEIVLGSLLGEVLPVEYTRTKSVSLLSKVEAEESMEDADTGNVATDIVFKIENGKSIVIPVKITTRERVVQPFAHQRILDGAFGEGIYTSLLCCVSETQRDDKKTKVNDICVPNTIILFQKHLAKIGGIFYLDPPDKYLELDGVNSLAVSTIGGLFNNRLATIVANMQIQI